MKRLMTMAVLAACACSKGGGVTVTQLGPSAACPAGGVEIDVSGQAPQQVCNGASGANGAAGSNGANGANGANGTSGAPSLVRQTPLAVGDAHCPAGGVQIDSGLDDGRGGGTAGDGVLEAGEIAQTSYVCKGSAGAVVGGLTPPDGAAGSARVAAHGGASSGGAGGAGGGITLSFKSGTDGGHLEVFRTGKPELSIALPPAPDAPDLGLFPVIVARDTTVQLAASPSPGAALAAGTLFVAPGQQSLFIASGSGAPAQAATGIAVAAGATLTFPSTSYVLLERSVVNLGTIAVAPDSQTQSGGALYLAGETYYGGAASALLARGADGAGMAGGFLNIFANGALINGGRLDVSGGAGPSGGAAGSAVLQSQRDGLINTGAIVARGGAGTAGAGGGGGSISVLAGTRLDNSGALDVRGGAGVIGSASVSAGGAGGYVDFEAFQTAGPAHNSGDIDASGGAAAGACQPAASCRGGAGGQITVASFNGAIVSTGALRTRGGSSEQGAGGDGGPLAIHTLAHDGTNADGHDELFPVGSILLSGDLDASGGDGAANGGNASNIDIQLDPGTTAAGQQIALFGYAAFDARGGSGTAGGRGGAIVLQQQTGSAHGSVLPGGAVVNYADFDTSGGDATTGAGGNAGNQYLATQHSAFFADAPWEILLNAGALTANGGSGIDGGQSGVVTLLGRHGATNTGAIAARGGAATFGGGGSGMTGNFSDAYLSYTVELASFDGVSASSGPIDVCGGAGPTGGAAGVIFMQGATELSNSAALQACGGAGTSAGGDGGQVTLLTIDGQTQNTAPAPAGISVAGGAASQGTAGGYGSVEVDGVLVTNAWVH